MRLQAGAVHIWRADLDALDTSIERLLDLRERERAARIVREPVRRRWVAARGILRVLIGAYMDEHPSALRFEQEAHGKPMLDQPGGNRLYFNLSHSGGLAVYALTELCPVGVDVELVARHSNTHMRREDFLRAWVRHEAEGKRLGVGVRNAAAQGRTRILQPWIRELDLGSDAIGAVALALAPVDFQVYAIDFGGYGSILRASTITIHLHERNVSE